MSTNQGGDVHRLSLVTGVANRCTNAVDCPCNPVSVERDGLRWWIHRPEDYVKARPEADVIRALVARGWR